MRVISKTNASSLKHPVSGEVFTPGDDGVFDLPHEFAGELVRKHAGQWVSEAVKQVADRRAAVAKLRDPQELATAVAGHGSNLARLEARIVALEERADGHDAANAAASVPQKPPQRRGGRSKQQDANERTEPSEADGETDPAE